MSDLADIIAGLSPEQQQLLQLRLAKLREESPPPLPPIRPQPRTAAGFPLSFAQQRMWFLDQLMPDLNAYNIPAAVRLSGTLDVAALERSFTAIVGRHEVLRTTYAKMDGAPVQVIGPAGAFRETPLPLIDLRDTPAEAREAAARQAVLDEASRPFDLAAGPLIRALLLRLGPREHWLILSMHHIASDGWSIGVLIRELAAFYRAYAQGLPANLPDLPIQYADYAAWQRDWLQGAVLETMLAYWRRRLADLPVLDLPADRPRPPIPSFRGARETVTLPKMTTDALKALSNQEGATLFMTLLAGFQVLLARYSGQDDIAVGSPIANRVQSETEALIGLFVNTLVLRADLSGNPSFRALLQRVRAACLQAYAHQNLPFEMLVAELQPDRDLSRNPLFDVMFVLLNTPLGGVSMPDLRLGPLEIEHSAAQFDLTLTLNETATGLTGLAEYTLDLFEPATIARMMRHFVNLLSHAVANPDRRLADLPLLSDAERHELLYTWNATGVDFPQDLAFHELFAAQAARAPDAAAVVCEAELLTYAELNSRATRLAQALAQHGAGPERIVAVFAERGIEFLTAILAIFKAGAAYLPLDPLQPPARLGQILAESAAALVLVAPSLRPALEQALERLPAGARPAVAQIADLLRRPLPAVELPAYAGPRQLAYVISTSGSTGTPKGAMIEHGGMLNHLWSKVADLGVTAEDRVAQTASPTFDISVWQFLTALLVGGQVHIFRDAISHDPRELLAQVASAGITLLEIVPSLLRMLLEELEPRGPNALDGAALRWLLLTGEALPPELCREWLRRYPRIPLLNAYGPSECSDDVSLHPLRRPPAADLARLPVGRPIANTQLYILDRWLSPAPIGAPGQLVVGGNGVGRGYQGRPDLTAERFIPDPFLRMEDRGWRMEDHAPSAAHPPSSILHPPSSRLYLTGDLCRFLPDGTIEYLGRIDHQVKVRGFRIELGEIEAVLGQHPQVREAAVLAQAGGSGGERLVAYVVPGDWRLEIGDSGADNLQSPISNLQSELRVFLREKLPDYMVPSAFVVLERLPLTPNGKLDRKALPAATPERGVLAQVAVEPRDPLEAVLAAIWAEVLELDRVGVHDNFFDLGGHSLQAVRVVARLEDAFPIELSLRLIFEAPTVAALAQRIEQLGRAAQLDVIHIAQLFIELNQLSDEEVSRMLAERGT